MHGEARYKLYAKDYGVVLQPSKPGEKYYEVDGGGIREPNIYKVNKTYYMFYDGAAMHYGECRHDDPERHLWRACLAKSKDLKSWEKLGVRLLCGCEEHKADNRYKDYGSASSPWLYFSDEHNKWIMYYVGADGAYPEGDCCGVPSFYYSTCVAYAKTEGLDGIEGEWIKLNSLIGNAKAVSFYKRKDRYPTGSTSPGPIIINPLWQGNNDKINKKYMMFFTSGGSIGIARSNDLLATQDFDGDENPNGWIADVKLALGGTDRPERYINVYDDVVSKKTSPENANYYYHKQSQMHFLFTNQFSHDITHTDCNVVYWTRDPNNWEDSNSAVIVDATSTKDGWATFAIGFPSVVEVDENTLAIFYDATPGYSGSHLGRKVALAYWVIPKIDGKGNIVDNNKMGGKV